MKSVDYSDCAITTRLKRLSQLRKLCLSLAKAKPASSQPFDAAQGGPSTANPPRD